MKTKLSIFCSKIIEAGWLAAAVAVPLFFNIYTARTFEPDKITLLRSIVSIMILAWIVLVVEQGSDNSGDALISLTDRFKSWLKTPLFLPTVLLVLIYIISTIFSISPKVSIWGSYQRLQGTYSALSYIVVFALMAGNLRTREQVDRLVTTVIIASIPVSLYGIVQRYGLDPLPWAGDVITRVASNMGNPIFVASYLIMIVPLTLSRLVESMTAIIKEEKASWGHTVLAAAYIFVLAIQIITVLFSGSRGPMLGVLGAGFVMGLLIILTLRRLHLDPAPLSMAEIGNGIIFVIPLALTGGIGGGVGYGVGSVLESAVQIEKLSLLGAVLGGLLGFLGLYTYMAATEKGWRWLWVSWLGIAVLAIGFVLALNLREPSLDPYLNPIRQIPYVSSLSSITVSESGTGKVRVLIWDAVLELIAPHKPLGIAEDELSVKDRFNIIRPLIGYGPESMFNAFAYVYPPDLAHVEARGSSADRSHNETMDSLVITGVLGFLAMYFIMISLFYYLLLWLGWAPDKPARQRLMAWLILGGLAGAIIPYFADGSFTFTALGLPFGLSVGVIIHLTWQGIGQRKPLLSQTEEPVLSQTEEKAEPIALLSTEHTLLLIGLLGAVIGHFIEVHFVFSIAATYTYFWIYAGLIVALSKIESVETASNQKITASSKDVVYAEQSPEPDTQTRRSSKRRSRRSAARRRTFAADNARATGYAQPVKRESWETWLGGQGLAMSIILIIMTFDFVTPQFQFDFSNSNSKTLFWLLFVTWVVGFAIALSNLATQRNNWPGQISWGRAVLLYAITSLSYSVFYAIAHRIQFGRRVTVTVINDVIRAADVLTFGLVVFYLFLLLLMVIIAITLSWRLTRNLVFWRAENWWLYPPLVLAILTVIWFKNIDVVRADIYLKEGERYRNNKQWNEAIALHEKGRSIDSDEDFYYLMLALDYQLMAQDTNLDQTQRQFAWQRGEEIALEAREINPYNPDNTGNMGRYYFTLGQIFNPDHFQDALAFFEKATILAPSNVIYHNLWAQTDYILQDYETAVDKLQTSVSIDPTYSPTWILLGDTYAAMGNVDLALMAHSEAIKLNARGTEDGFSKFADQFLDQRLNFYISAGQTEDLVAVLQKLALDRPDEARIQWLIGYIYNRQGQRENAIPYLEAARALGDDSDRTIRALANIHLALNSLEKALPFYQLLLEKNSNDVEAHSALAFIYAQQGNLQTAIEHNLAVVEQLPDDYDSWKNLTLLYRDNGQLEQALEAAHKAQAVAPEAEAAGWPPLITDLENRLATNN